MDADAAQSMNVEVATPTPEDAAQSMDIEVAAPTPEEDVQQEPDTSDIPDEAL